MKYIIIGLHSSGKKAIAEDLRVLGHRVGNNFRSTKTLTDSQYTLSSVHYEYEDIENIFESQSYIFMNQYSKNGLTYYEGLSCYEFNNNDVFIMSPDQFNNVPEFNEDICFVWLDNSQGNRYTFHAVENRKYDFFEQEAIETIDTKDFINRIYKYKLLYFNNEDPSRVAAILHALLINPDLIDVFIERFN